ncbi:hypothetical protein LS684_02890 [Cytobacillus spongiae]|jgi:hypothetical protein|uniref:hypothetical protein n=1 Tax=Cytobacillus spongiae TaxID=2901381 RepID=UPI001F26B645|nr:hypothetical protein [Cytobacillus spongiae]UII56450.1 hypothetical protein LS684_02890 [Cytobacillus spongiae]
MVKMNIQQLKINTLSEMSGVYSGDNVHIDNSHHGKKNEGFGIMIGDGNRILHGKHIVIKKNDRFE